MCACAATVDATWPLRRRQSERSRAAAMPGQAHATTSRPVISAIAAQLFVADIKASCDFLTQKFGFSIVFTYGEPPFYAQVKRDRALLNRSEERRVGKGDQW